MIETAQEKSSEVEWVLGHLENLDSDLAPLNVYGSVDVVWLSSAISHFAESFDGVFGQISQVLRRGGKLLIREATLELIKESDWYSFFFDAHGYIDNRYASCSKIVQYLHQCGFLITNMEVCTETEHVSAEEIVERYRTRAYSWCRVYENEEDLFEARLTALKQFYLDTKSPLVKKNYLFCAERR